VYIDKMFHTCVYSRTRKKQKKKKSGKECLFILCRQ